MALEGLERTSDKSSEIAPIRYVPEFDRNNFIDPFAVWIRPKDAEAANKTLKRYAEISRERKGTREINLHKLNAGDIAEWSDLVVRIENYRFSNQFPELRERGVIKEITDWDEIRMVFKDIENSITIEVFDAATDKVLLDAGSKNVLRSSSTTSSGNPKSQSEVETTTVTSAKEEGRTGKESAS